MSVEPGAGPGAAGAADSAAAEGAARVHRGRAAPGPRAPRLFGEGVGFGAMPSAQFRLDAFSQRLGGAMQASDALEALD